MLCAVDDLGEEASATYTRLQTNPGKLNPAVLQNYGALIQGVKGPINAPPPEDNSLMSNLVLYAAIAVVVALLVAGGLYLYRLLRKGSGTQTAVMVAAEASRKAEKTNFRKWVAPDTQTMICVLDETCMMVL
jgi:hypothetical protein